MLVVLTATGLTLFVAPPPPRAARRALRHGRGRGLFGTRPLPRWRFRPARRPPPPKGTARPTSPPASSARWGLRNRPGRRGGGSRRAHVLQLAQEPPPVEDERGAGRHARLHGGDDERRRDGEGPVEPQGADPHGDRGEAQQRLEDDVVLPQVLLELLGARMIGGLGHRMSSRGGTARGKGRSTPG